MSDPNHNPLDKLDPQALREAVNVESTVESPEARLSTADRIRLVRTAGRGILRAVIALVVLIVIGSGAWWVWQHRPAPPDGTVTGIVTDLEGNPLRGIQVRVEGFEEGHTSFTDAQGHFTVTVPSGHRWLVIEQPGVSGVALEISIQAGERLEVPPVMMYTP